MHASGQSSRLIFPALRRADDSLTTTMKLSEFQSHLRQHPDGRCVLWYVPAPGARSDIAQALMSACAPLLAGAPLQVVRRDSIPLTRAHKLRTFVQVAEDDSAQ